MNRNCCRRDNDGSLAPRSSRVATVTRRCNVKPRRTCTGSPSASSVIPACVWLVFATLLMATADAEETESDSVAQFTDEAAQYKFTETDSDTPLTMHARPLLHWDNPARNGEDGAVYLWKAGQRPAVIGTCFTYRYRERTNRKHAFHVLSQSAVRATHRDRVVWNPPARSLEYKSVAGAPSPASTPSGRNAQMRGLARRFRVEVTQRDGRKEQARLVPQPLYRFEAEASNKQTSAGAIFSFALGTDPEALLVLETKEDDSGNARWHYALVRFTFYPLEGFFENESIWKVEESESLSSSILARPDYQREPYVTFRPNWLD